MDKDVDSNGQITYTLVDRYEFTYDTPPEWPAEEFVLEGSRPIPFLTSR